MCALPEDRLDLGHDRGERLSRWPDVDGLLVRSWFGLPLDAEAQEVEALVDVGDRGLFLREAQPHGGQQLCHLVPQRLGMLAGAGHQDDEVVGVSHQAIGGQAPLMASATRRVAAPRLPDLREMLVEDRKRNVGQQRRQDAALGCAGLGPHHLAVLGEDARGEERVHQRQDTLVPDPIAHPAHEGGVVDLVEARRDVTLQDPLIGVDGEVVDLGHGVLGPALRAEAVGTRLEVRLEDGLQHQFQGGLHDPVPHGRDAQAAAFAVRFGDHPLPHGKGPEPLGLEIISQLSEHPAPEDDVARFHAIDPSGSCSTIASHPMPRHHKEGGIGDEVVRVTEPTVRALGCPLVQLGLHTQYLGHGLIEVGPQIAGVHQRTPAFAMVSLLTRWVPSPCRRLSRPRTTTDPPPHPGAISRQRACPPPHGLCGGEGNPGVVPTFTINRSTGSAPSSAPATSPHLRRRPSVWPPPRPPKSGFGVANPQRVRRALLPGPHPPGWSRSAA